MAAVSGIALGLLANGVLAAFGLAALLQAAPHLWIGLRIAGAGMMAWLAIGTWRGAGKGFERLPPKKSVAQAFATGALINLLNPKAYIFFLVVAPQFIAGGHLSLNGALVLSVISVAIATTIHLAIVVAGGRAHAWLKNPSRTKMVQRVFAVILLGLAVSFLWADLG